MELRVEKRSPRSLSQDAHRRAIGICGFVLPPGLYLLAVARPIQCAGSWEILDSISAYAHTGGSFLFSGVLVALGMFLWNYRGYEGSLLDRVLGHIGGLCAFGVAAYPTAAPDPCLAPEWWKTVFGQLHLTAAAGLFTVFIIFTLLVFRKSSVPKGQELPGGKKARNRVYAVCGIVMIACIAWIVVTFVTADADADIFWPESIALWAFAFSWLQKGRADRAIRGGLQRLKPGAA